MAGDEGLEPPTCGFGVRCSTNWASRLRLLRTAIIYIFLVFASTFWTFTKIFDFIFISFGANMGHVRLIMLNLHHVKSLMMQLIIDDLI